MIGFIGAGNMGGAIISSIITNKIISENELFICDRDTGKKEAYPNALFTTEPCDLAEKCDMVFLAVKPNQIEDVLKTFLSSGKYESGKTVFVTIAAGISISFIQNIMGKDCPVIRVMPNTPVMVGKGVSALSASENVSEEVFAKVKNIFSASGTAFTLTEDKMNAVISLTSSSPAYLFLLADAMSEGAALQGFSKEEAAFLSAAVFAGAAEMIMKSGKTPMELADMVTSPGGTTRAARDVFEKYDFKNAVIEAMLACTKRAEELGK